MGNCIQGKQTKGAKLRQYQIRKDEQNNIQNNIPNSLQAPATEVFSDLTKTPSDNNILTLIQPKQTNGQELPKNIEKLTIKEILENIQLLQQIREEKLRPRISLSFDKSTIMNKRRNGSIAKSHKSLQ